MTLPIDTLLRGGTYKIVRFISSGGFGCTYEAEHVMLEKRVAIKEFFVKDFCNRDETTAHVTVGTVSKRALVDKLRHKFVDEAKALCRLQHSGIVKVSDVFEENGTAYFVMDYVDGLSLGDMVGRHGAMPEARAVRYIRQVAEALRYVHDNNRLHLDIKPGNIMVDADDNAVLIDFGTSKQYDEESGENTSALMGKTPGYAPLEQMGNDVVKFLPATDIYALGATLYKLLTGVTPLSASLLANGEKLDPLPDTISDSTRRAIAAAMDIKVRRPQTIDEFLAILDAPAPVGATATPLPESEDTVPDIDIDVAAQSEIKRSANHSEPASRPDLTPNPESQSVAHKSPESVSRPSFFGRHKGLVAMIFVAVFAFIGFMLLSGNGGDEQSVEASVAQVPDTPDVHDYVDLGLSVMWATCNVGAESPSDYGDYFAWGETTPKSEYTEENSKTLGKNISDIAGNAQYDAARANWGGSWRMPTKEEFQELVDKCTWTWAIQGSHTGYKVTSKLNGNSIFLPAAGWRYGSSSYDVGESGYCWGSTPSESDMLLAYYLFFDGGGHGVGRYYRYYGFSLRPVFDNTATTDAAAATTAQQRQTSSTTPKQDDAELEAQKQREAQAAEQARSAEQKRQQEEAEQARLAEEKRKQQEAEQARLTEQKRKQEEAEQARLAEERRKQDEAAKPKPTTGTIAGHDWVDLGLSVKWATCNVGASSPSDYGNYYAWGETTTKSEYTDENCKTWKPNFKDISGKVKYDVARFNWNSTWRLPTKEEMQELIDKCTWTWATQGGHNGYKVTSKTNGNSIFLPVAGMWHMSLLPYALGAAGFYWSSTPEMTGSQGSFYLELSGHKYRITHWCRAIGCSVRPVSE